VQRDPLTLDLYYLLIPVAPNTDPAAFLSTYSVLGIVSRSMHDRGIFTLGQWVTDAPAEDVANDYRVSFNPLSTGELFELWEAVNQPYRLSLSYVVRTARIDSALTSDTRLVSERAVTMTEK